MKMIVCFLVVIASIFACQAQAKDVHVKGHYRKDGTYVRPHVRSSPDSYKYNNYGPSKSDAELMNPSLRDNDNDGIQNSMDTNDDNDGITDDTDEKQYTPSSATHSTGEISY